MNRLCIEGNMTRQDCARDQRINGTVLETRDLIIILVSLIMFNYIKVIIPKLLCRSIFFFLKKENMACQTDLLGLGL